MYIHVYVYTPWHAGTVFPWKEMYTCVNVYMRTCICIYIFMYIHMYTCVHVYVEMYTCVHVYVYIYSCTYILTYIYVYTYKTSSVSLWKDVYIYIHYFASHRCHTFAKEPNIIAKQPYITAKQPYITAKEPYITPYSCKRAHCHTSKASTPIIDAGIRGNIRLFCGNIRLFCGNIRLFCTHRKHRRLSSTPHLTFLQKRPTKIGLISKTSLPK